METPTWNATTSIKDYFDTGGGNGQEQVFFTTSFLKKQILYQWQPQKDQNQRNSIVFLS